MDLAKRRFQQVSLKSHNHQRSQGVVSAIVYDVGLYVSFGGRRPRVCDFMQEMIS